MSKYCLFSLFLHKTRCFYEKGRFPKNVLPTTKGDKCISKSLLHLINYLSDLIYYVCYLINYICLLLSLLPMAYLLNMNICLLTSKDGNGCTTMGGAAAEGPNGG